MPFDLGQARRDGIPDDEILKHLADSAGFDVNQALADGKTKGQILAHLAQTAQPPNHRLDLGSALKTAAHDIAPYAFDDTPHSPFGTVGKLTKDASGKIAYQGTNEAPLGNELRRANDSLMGAAEDVG